MFLFFNVLKLLIRLLAQVKEGAIVIDVGINRVPETGKLVGDVDFAAASTRAGPNLAKPSASGSLPNK